MALVKKVNGKAFIAAHAQPIKINEMNSVYLSWMKKIDPKPIPPMIKLAE